jgi:hypothetical protein
MLIEPSWIALIISIITTVIGGVSHFFVVIKKQVEMDTRLKQVESDLVELKKHIPLMEKSINDVHTIVARMDGQQQVILNQFRK